MAEENSTTANEVDVLRDVLATLGRRLDQVEQWRALRQLDERERNGNPLEGIDGVLFRGRLVQGLAKSSREWRAYVRIEEAIGHLHGPERLETGILKEPPHFEVQPCVANAQWSSAADTSVGHKPRTAPAGTKVAGAQPVDGDRSDLPDMADLTADNDAQDGQRQRYKVRAGSLLLPSTPPTPIRAILPAPLPLPISKLPPAAAEPPAVNAANIPPVASLRPRPPVDQAEPDRASASDDPPHEPESPRSVLQRIRIVTRPPQPTRPPQLQPPQSLAPAAQEAPAPLPSSAANLPALAVIPTPSEAGKNTAAGPYPDTPSSTATAASEQRLDDLEAELGHLIDRSASWPHPLDAARAAIESDAPFRSVAQRADSAGLEPDTSIELEVDEAEVTIVRIARAERALTERQRDQPVDVRRPVAVAAPRAGATNGADGNVASREKDVTPRDDYAGSRLDLEEASVEIIIQEPAARAERT